MAGTILSGTHLPLRWRERTFQNFDTGAFLLFQKEGRKRRKENRKRKKENRRRKKEEGRRKKEEERNKKLERNLKLPGRRQDKLSKKLHYVVQRSSSST
jgi:hypothetical protein